MNCPYLKTKCDPECIFYINDGCLEAEYYKEYITASKEAQQMLKQIFPTLANLPPEVREKFPENLKRQIEEFLDKEG
jgi:hypothetical protein